jgi:MYXO-CTERM domain-containing protein
VASAGDGVRVRSEVVWDGAPCSTRADKAASSTLHLDYAVLFEETEPTVDEVADGRRNQFFAMCRDNSPQEFVPRWITWADVQAAVDVGLLEPDTIEPDQVLEDPASSWSDCFIRINADDARAPITDATAAGGVDWDLTTVDPGVYIVHGYTWDPVFNQWAERPGFVKVFDGDPDAAGPGVAVTSQEQVLYLDEIGLVEGCVDAGPGATMDVYWSFVEVADWQPYMMGEPVDGDAFGFEFDPPEAIVGESVMIRVDVHAAGMSYTGYMNDLIIVLTTNNPDACTNGGGFLGDPGCADSGGDDSGSAGGTAGGTSGPGGTGGGTTGGEATTAMADGGDDGGGTCACRSGDSAGSGGLGVLGLLGLLGLRRRPRR